MSSALMGQRVKVFGGFDFIKEQSLAGAIVQVGQHALLLALDEPLAYLGKRFEHVVVQACRDRGGFDALLFHGVVDCHCLWVPVERFNPDRPLEVAWWRGSDSVVSTLLLAERGDAEALRCAAPALAGSAD